MQVVPYSSNSTVAVRGSDWEFAYKIASDVEPFLTILFNHVPTPSVSWGGYGAVESWLHRC